MTSDPNPPGARRTVLIVDDDREVQRFLSERFEKRGWRVICERDGDWALRSFERRHVDAVVLDILIPVVNGFQVAERIRAGERGRHVGIVMLTGIYRGPRHRAEAVEKYGLLEYLDKPVDGDQVVGVLERHFAGLPAGPATPRPERAPSLPALVDDRQKQERREVEKAARSSASAAAGEPARRGNLKRTSFPRLLAELYQARVDGGLFLLRDKIKKIVYFQGGHPTFIKSNVLDECLGRVLVRERMITEEECEDSVRRMKKDKRQQGSVLIEMGVISPHNLRFALELQLQIKLFDIFDWPEAEYVFRADVPMPAEVIALDMSAAQIVLEGIRRHYHHDRLDKALAPLVSSYPELAADPARRFQELELGPAELDFVRRMDGRTRLGDLFEAPAGLDRHGAKALVLGLEAMGVIALRSAPARARTVPPLPDLGVPEELSGPSDTLPSARPDLSAAGAAGGEAFSDAELAALLADRRGRSPFQVLGVAPGASSDELDRAYGQLLRELHPDRYRGRPASTLALASEAFALVEAAFAALRDPRRRAAAAAAADAPAPLPPVPAQQLIDEATNPTAPSGDPAARALAGDKLFRDGEARLRARDFSAAAHAFARAVDLRPDMGLYRAYLGWAQFCADGSDAAAAQGALPVLEDAVAQAPILEHPHLFLGLVLSVLGDVARAEAELEKAVQVNPDSSEALRALKTLHARRGRA